MKRFKKIIKIILLIASTAAFGQFIIEEALQNYGFGVSMLIMNKMYRNSVEKAEYTLGAVEEYQAFHNGCAFIMCYLYVGNPLTAVWFHKFMEADQKKIDQYHKLVKEELYYLISKQQRVEKKTLERYQRKKDNQHINSILPNPYGQIAKTKE